MGIQFLNSYIKKHTSEKSLEIINFNKLSGKVIAIDINIYLHKFLAEGDLFENLYLMFSLLKYYNIIPIFVFDGKPPPEKYELINKRYQERLIAESQYKKLCETKNLEKREQEIINLKRKFLKPSKSEIKITQNLMNAFGLTYIEADGEADIVCAKLVIKKYAYACLSEDMDMFVYGCPRIIRYLSLSNENCVLYTLDIILKELDLTFNEFKEICILAGTDYNNGNKDINLLKAIELFNQFKNFKITNIKFKEDFYTWISKYHNCVDNIFELYNICNMFKTDTISIKKFKISISNTIDYDGIKKIMEPHGFIFFN